VAAVEAPVTLSRLLVVVRLELVSAEWAALVAVAMVGWLSLRSTVMDSVERTDSAVAAGVVAVTEQPPRIPFPTRVPAALAVMGLS
jgi:hypothetical protein